MRLVYSVLFSLIAFTANAQKTLLVPGSPLIQQKLIMSDVSDMNWYMMQGATKILLGNVTTEVQRNNSLLYVITKVKMKQFGAPWVDSTVAEAGTLKPVYHSSFNSQRTMYLSFARGITGRYQDFINKTDTTIQEEVKSPFFDSNLYPALIRWLPLKDGYTQDIAIYNYDPKSKSGVMKASITAVKKANYESLKAGKRLVWVVTVQDEISDGATSTYFIDQLNRKVWKQEIDMPGRKMLMEAE